MNIQGLTSEFSLPELLRFLQESQQTGRLSFKPVMFKPVKQDPEKLLGSGRRLEKTSEISYLFWFARGNLIAVSNRVDGLGLLHMLQSRSLIQSETLPQLLRQCPPQASLGSFLRDRALITNKQLKSLFVSQVLKQICMLLKAPDAKFAFHELSPLPYLEMTGVSIRATDVTLPSLRILKDWSALTDKLPSLESGLKSAGVERSTYRLQTQEKDVLCLAEKGLSLRRISKVLKLPTLDTQKVGFRLIFLGLVKEVPLQITIDTDKTARNSAVQRIKTVINRDRAGRLPAVISNGSSFL